MFAIANACVKWYRISSFEGASGYYVVGLAMLGALGGFVVSMLTARLGYSFIGRQWYSQFGAAITAVLVVLVIVWALALAGSRSSVQ